MRSVIVHLARLSSFPLSVRLLQYEHLVHNRSLVRELHRTRIAHPSGLAFDLEHRQVWAPPTTHAGVKVMIGSAAVPDRLLALRLDPPIVRRRVTPDVEGAARLK